MALGIGCAVVLMPVSSEAGLFTKIKDGVKSVGKGIGRGVRNTFEKVDEFVENVGDNDRASAPQYQPAAQPSAPAAQPYRPPAYQPAPVPPPPPPARDERPVPVPGRDYFGSSAAPAATTESAPQQPWISDAEARQAAVTAEMQRLLDSPDSDVSAGVRPSAPVSDFADPLPSDPAPDVAGSEVEAWTPDLSGPPATAAPKPPVAIAVPGRRGIVFSPFASGQMVDVAGLAPGTLVKDPYSEREFRVP